MHVYDHTPWAIYVLPTLPRARGENPNTTSERPCQTRENLYSIASRNPDRSTLRRRQRLVADATEPQAAGCEVRGVSHSMYDLCRTSGCMQRAKSMLGLYENQAVPKSGQKVWLGFKHALL